MKGSIAEFENVIDFRVLGPGDRFRDKV